MPDALKHLQSGDDLAGQSQERIGQDDFAAASEPAAEAARELHQAADALRAGGNQAAKNQLADALLQLSAAANNVRRAPQAKTDADAAAELKKTEDAVSEAAKQLAAEAQRQQENGATNAAARLADMAKYSARRRAETNAGAGASVAARRGAERGAREEIGRTRRARRAAAQSGADVTAGPGAAGGPVATRTGEPEQSGVASRQSRRASIRQSGPEQPIRHRVRQARRRTGSSARTGNEPSRHAARGGRAIVGRVAGWRHGRRAPRRPR